MSTFEISETYINVDGYTAQNGEPEPVIFGESGWMPAYPNSRGQIFRDSRSEFGGCTSKMYRDRRIRGTEAGTSPYPVVPASVKRSERCVTEEVGWVFSKRMRYEDARPDYETGRYSAKDYYTREVWVEVREVES